MKCCIQNLAIILWHLVLHCLSLSDDTGIRRRHTSGDSNLVKKDDISYERASSFLKFLDLKGLPYIVLTSSNGAVGVMNRMVYESKKIFGFHAGLWGPKEILEVPEGAFTFPAFATIDGFVELEKKSRIFVVDASNPENLKFHEIIEDVNYDFRDLVWINNDIIASKTDIESRTEIVYLKSKTGSEITGPWEQTMIADLKVNEITRMLLFKNVWNNYDAIYAIDRNSKLLVMWSENEADKPGDWLKNKFKTETVSSFDNLGDMKLADVNLDGRLDLLLAFRVANWQVSAYVIPDSADFKNPAKYELFPLLSYPVLESFDCPNILKTFAPFNSYHGKPWLLLGGYTCKVAFYAVPQYQDPQNWNYTSYKIEVHDKSNVKYSGLEAADMDEDGFVELFVSLGDNEIIRAFSFEENFMNLYTGFTTRSASKPTSPKDPIGYSTSSTSNSPSAFVVCSYVLHLILRYFPRIRS